MKAITHLVLAAAVLWPCSAKLAFSQLVPGTTFTVSGPALAYYNGYEYLAWTDSNGNVEFTDRLPSTPWNPAVSAYAESAQAPALAVASETLYLAWTAAGFNKVALETVSGSSVAFAGLVCWSTQAGACADTTLAPALASNGLTLYLAWTNSSDAVEMASYSSGKWTFLGTVPGVTTTQSPALSVDGTLLYLAWVPKGGSSIEYATLPLTGGSWSKIGQVEGTGWTAETTVSPAFGISSVPGHNGLWIAWSAANGTTYEIDYSLLHLTDTLTWEWSQPIPVPPSVYNPILDASYPALNLTPALLGYTVVPESGAYTTFSFAAAYTSNTKQIYMDDPLQTDTVVHKTPPCGCPTCCY